ncbi:DUF3037 domain-containing protein [Janthinobacterium lividum]|uniref:DUF3037 domain-containing protein n=1 Tax=Janthinobacterium lividum TaxID=29581 RepID=UPI000873719B|nr:DUF3037 domain-containing protein [Janthinobacterium lividum]MCC7713166.1 DUF3037 domain-containing protein [Janthinobacterium lividum]OEZ57314.1 hypothetical protein JANLI_24410 [Janthinobacterium lividum]WQE26241.1 DUF3037 domain-containing protein [Janthinobacterium lividum]STQ97128.1 Protein of uncharacterised function (DUF3037) [Janthinobacterium lividum]
MKKFACQYALLRFRPFVETGEFANVGIALIAPEARFFGFRILKRYGRITQFFHQLDRQIYLDGRQLFKEEMDRFALELRRLALDGRKTQPNIVLARNLFAEVVRPREAMLQFADQRVVLAEDPKAKLLQLFDHYVERNFVTKEYQERLLENNVRKLLINAQIGARYQREKLGTEDFAVNFPFVDMVEGKAERVIKPLYLAQGDSTKILTHGGQWVDKVRRLRKRNALPPKVLFPVTQPAANTKPYHAFQEIRQDLLAENVQVVAADDERQILKFATDRS